MTRVNVYLPDDLAARVRAAGLNVSALTRRAVEAELTDQAASTWLEQLAALPPAQVGHGDVITAVAAAREEIADQDG